MQDLAEVEEKNDFKQAQNMEQMIVFADKLRELKEEWEGPEQENVAEQIAIPAPLQVVEKTVIRSAFEKVTRPSVSFQIESPCELSTSSEEICSISKHQPTSSPTTGMSIATSQKSTSSLRKEVSKNVSPITQKEAIATDPKGKK